MAEGHRAAARGVKLDQDGRSNKIEVRYHSLQTARSREYHTLQNKKYGLLAFPHVYRGGGETTDYKVADGWELVKIQRSSEIVKMAKGKYFNNWSVSHIDRYKKTFDSKFIAVKYDNNLKGSKVILKDDGKSEYE